MAASLEDTAFKVCCRSLKDTIINHGGGQLKLVEGTFLPASLCDALFDAVVESLPLDYIEIFTDRERCQMTKLHLLNQKLKVHQNIIKSLFEHNLKEVNLSNSYLDAESAKKLGDNGKNLKCLILSGTKGNWKSKGGRFLHRLTHLTKLDVSFIKGPFAPCLSTISGLTSLVSLDLSSTEIQSILPLGKLSCTLQQLFLYNACENVKNYIQELDQVIPQMEALTHLDISKCCSAEGVQDRMETYLSEILLKKIASLPNLCFLDLSGCEQLQVKELEALREGLSRQLNFLGVFATILQHLDNLPADKVSGFATEEQLFLAMHLYEKRETYVIRALHGLFNFLIDNELDSPPRALQLTVSSSKLHLMNPAVQVVASACIYHILQQENAMNLDIKIRRSTISFVVDILENHTHSNILQNCLQCLLYFNIAEELEFESVRCGSCLLKIMKLYIASSCCLTALRIFNELIRNASMKVEFGILGAVKILLDLIRNQYEVNRSGRLAAMAWCTLWNITDETPYNCEDFIDNDGLYLFKEGIALDSGRNDLQSNIMGVMLDDKLEVAGPRETALELLGNISEVHHLRCKLMEHDTIHLFIQLLDSESFDLEVSYHAAGSLSHICSDGDEAWTLNTISRSDCMKLVVDSISKWDVGTLRAINYRSLMPILQLLPLDFNSCGQEWAVWALANLTEVHPETYCELLKSEGGVALLKHLLNSEKATNSMRLNANVTLERVENYEVEDA